MSPNIKLLVSGNLKLRTKIRESRVTSFGLYGDKTIFHIFLEVKKFINSYKCNFRFTRRFHLRLICFQKLQVLVHVIFRFKNVQNFKTHNGEITEEENCYFIRKQFSNAFLLWDLKVPSLLPCRFLW